MNQNKENNEVEEYVEEYEGNLWKGVIVAFILEGIGFMVTYGLIKFILLLLS